MLVELGHAFRTHGLAGNVMFSLLDGISGNVLQEGKKVFLFPLQKSRLPVEGRCFFIRYINIKGRLMAFEDMDYKDQIRPLLPFSIHMERELLPPLPEGEFYPADLLGLSVTDNENGEDMGIVKDYYYNKGQVILRIEGEETYELPMVKEFFPVLSVDRLEIVRPEFI